MPSSLRAIAKSGVVFVITEASISEKSGAGILHAGICTGAAGQLAVLPRWLCYKMGYGNRSYGVTPRGWVR